MSRNILCHHTACSDHCTVADAHSRQDDYVPSDPHVVADADGVSILQSGITLFHVQRMSGGIDAHIGSDEYIVADADVRSVQNHQVGVCKEILSDVDVVTIVAVERRNDASSFAHVHNAAYQPVPFLATVGRQQIVFVQQTARLQHFLLQLRIIVGIVQQPFGRFLFFGFHKAEFECLFSALCRKFFKGDKYSVSRFQYLGLSKKKSFCFLKRSVSFLDFFKDSI